VRDQPVGPGWWLASDERTLSAAGSMWTFTFSTTDPEADQATVEAIMESFTAAD
jgi:hypothetical protein